MYVAVFFGAFIYFFIFSYSFFTTQYFLIGKIGILGATMQVVGSSMVYRCEAIGQPLNEVTVSWDARRSGRSSSMRVRIPDDDSIVSTRRILSLIVSTLTLDEDSEFSEPRCTAMLGDDHDFRDLNANFEEIQSKHMH